MFFKATTDNPILRLSISSSGLDKSIAYGPGSVINGSIFLKLSQPLHVQQLSIVFECQVHQHQKQKQEQQQQAAILFSVTEHIRLNQQTTGIAHDNETTVIAAGSHMHLFAIQLPLVNYPPTIAETTSPDACHIEYRLEAFLERPGLATLFSDRLSLTYLPLVVAPVNGNDEPGHVTTSRQHSFMIQQNPDTAIQIHACMLQSAYCIGEECKIKLTTDNPLNDNINQIYVTFMTQLSTHHYQQQHSTQFINYHQTIPISIPKQTKHHVSYLSIPIAQSCLPTFDYHHQQLGITINVDHHIIIGLIPSHHHQQSTTTKSSPTAVTVSTASSLSSSRFFSFGSFYGNSNSSSSSFTTSSPLYLPIMITTIPTRDTTKSPSVPLILQHDDATNNSTSPLQPYFISSSASSPIPTGINKGNLHDDDDDDDDDDQYSVSPSSSFKLEDAFAMDQNSTTSAPPPPSLLHQQHLTVPSSTSVSSTPVHPPLSSSGSPANQLGTTQG